MIRVTTIPIDEFRGVRDLGRDLAMRNLGILDPNGTGKTVSSTQSSSASQGT
jgi:hypothetical protein